jgi:uncharacterized membrane protein YhdT
MLLFLGGIDLPGLVVVIVILALVGTGIFYLIRPLVGRLLKNQSRGVVNVVSRLAAFVLTPLLFVLVIYFVFIYPQIASHTDLSTQTRPRITRR